MSFRLHLFLFLTLSFPSVVNAIVWDGPSITFVRADNVNPALAENQDRITESVWLTRGGNGALYNINQETAFDGSVSPMGTRWAFEDRNGNPSGATFSAANHGQLVFSTLLQSLGNMQIGHLIADGRRGVLHIVESDIYIDIQFTSWSFGPAPLGGFSYQRNTAPVITDEPRDETVPLPLWALAILASMLSAIAYRHRFRHSR